MSGDAAMVWASNVIIECPFCAESITNPATGEEWWYAEDFLYDNLTPILHSPCDRVYEVPSPFDEPLLFEHYGAAQ